jgi:serine phosphatase RsbU (regulator of sigma subunit)/anti-sigma regulatory factor (Ser/Thr protein kinase)
MALGDAGTQGGTAEDAREAIRRIADTALGYLSLEEMLGELLERIRDVLGVDTAAILLLDEDRGVLLARAAKGIEEEVRQGVQIPLARGFAGRVAAEVRPVVIEDLSRADVVNPLLRAHGIRSMLGVPLHIEGRVIGVMHVGTLHTRRFGEEDTALLQLAADRAAHAIDAARASELRAVTEIMQRTLLPDALPRMPGLRFSAKYLPAGSGVKIGGDWYDVFQLPDGRLTFVIGDVVGRGVVAASVMAEIRIALRAYLMEGHALGKVMGLLNELLVSMGRHRSATAAILELDLDRGELEWVSAGHVPSLMYSPETGVDYLEHVQGIPLGIVRGARYASAKAPFPTGSSLLLYTDGLVERRGEAIDEGLERLRDATERAVASDDGSLADRVYNGLLEVAMVDSATLEDDVALLAIESLPLAGELDMTLDADPAALAGLRRLIGRWLGAQGIGESDVFAITLAVSEAAANAIEHAYGGREATFALRCTYDRAGGEVVVKVTDTGRWRESHPYGRGRGLVIMRSLVDDVSLDRGESGTTVTLSKRIAADQATDQA